MTTSNFNLDFFKSSTINLDITEVMHSAVDYLLDNNFSFDNHEESGVSQSTYVDLTWVNPSDEDDYVCIQIRFSDHDSRSFHGHNYNWMMGNSNDMNLTCLMDIVNELRY